MDEEALLKQFAAQFAHGPDDADDTDAAAAAQGADSTANQVADDADQSPATFDTQQFLNGLDAIFDRHTAATEAGPYLEQAMVDAENAGDEAGLLTVLNETMGFYRSQGRHKENQWIVQRALELAARMGLTTGTSEAWAITLINCATSMRAAKQYDQAEDLYHQAQSVCRHSLAPTDRRLAALHNNLSMLYSETNRPDKAELELREALRIIEASSVNPDADIDVSSSHTNLALTLLTEHKLEDAHWHAAKALEIYRTGHLEHSAHYASALAGFAQVCFAERRYADAVTGYRHALAVIEECYGKDTDYWRITADNLRQAEEAAAQAGGDVQCFLGCFDHQRTGTAERILHSAVAPDKTDIGNGSGQRFLDGGQRGVFAITALMQAVAGGIQHHFHHVFTQGKADFVQSTGFRQSGGFVAVLQPLNDCLFDNALAGRYAGKLAGQAGALDRELGIHRDQLLPRDRVNAVEQFIKGGRLVAGQQQHHALHRAQVEVGRGDHIGTAGKAQTAILYPDVLCADAGQLKLCSGLAPKKAGSDQFKFCRHCNSFLSAKKQTCPIK